MPCHFYREPRSVVSVRGSAVIQDNGVLQGTAVASNGNYLFSEVGAGTKPLVVIGTTQEVLRTFESSPFRCIENRIRELPGIYMGVNIYKPGHRFKGLFPVHMAVQALVEGAAGFVPGSALTDIAGAIKDLKESIEFTRGKIEWYTESNEKLPDTTGQMYVRFSYMAEKDNMTRIGTRLLSFKTIHAVLRQLWSA